MIFFGKRKKLEEENVELRQKISELGGLSILEIENKAFGRQIVGLFC